jgi:hypothetical protein
MDNTFTLKGGRFTQYGSKTNLHITGSSNIVSAETEVNVSPQWQIGAPSKEDGFIAPNEDVLGTYPDPYGFNETPLYTKFKVTGNEDNIGSRLTSSNFTPPSASDKNSSDIVTISYVDVDGTDFYGGSILTASLDYGNPLEITTSSFNLIINNGNPATFRIETASGFGPIHQDAKLSWWLKATDSSNVITRANDYPEDSFFYATNIYGPTINFNDAFYIRFEVTVDNESEAAFIISESATVNVSDNLTPDDHLPILEWNLGNEDNPNYDLVEFFIKDRDKLSGPSPSGNDIDDLFTDNNLSDGLYVGLDGDSYAADLYYQAGIMKVKYTRNGQLVLSGSDKVSDANIASDRYFKVKLRPENHNNSPLTAAGSPYLLPISTSINGGVYKSSSILLTVNNLDPVWTPSSLVVTSSWTGLNNKLANLVYPSASDPGEDNITLTVTKTISPTPLISVYLNDFVVNEFEGSDTGSFTITNNNAITPAEFVNGRLTVAVTAEDEVSPTPGSAICSFTASFVVPPYFRTAAAGPFARSRDTSSLIIGDENNIGNNISDFDLLVGASPYTSVFTELNQPNPIQGVCNLDTGSGFIIESNDNRVLDSWFIFSGNNSTNGDNAVFTIETSSLFQRVDADITASLFITASDFFNQTASNDITIRITNEDTIEDVVPQFSYLNFFIAPGITGSTNYLANDVILESEAFSTSVTSIVGGPFLSTSPNSMDNDGVITSANGTSGLNFKIIDNNNTENGSPYLNANSLDTGEGTLIMWYKKNGSGAGTIIQSPSYPDFRAFTGTGTNLLMYWGSTGELLSDSDHFTNYNDYYQLALTWSDTTPNYVVRMYGNKDLVDSETITNTAIATYVEDAFASKIYFGSGSLGVLDTSIAIMAYYNKELTLTEIEDFFHAFSGSFGY